MFETLYKTDAPKTFLDGGEYYQPSFDFEFRNGAQTFFVREKHGYWDEGLKTFANQTVTLSPQDGFATFEEAQARYNEQLKYRASRGFVHSFSLDFMSETPVQYRRLDLS
jgi:hypothetical protein